MDYDKLIERFRYDAADWGGYPHIKRDLLDAATAIETFRGEIAKLRDSRDRWKKCAENFSAGVEQRDREDDAIQEENEKLRANLDRVTAERDAAVKDMEALMWFSGEGCHICAHEIIIHKEPYVRSKCALGNCAACCPTWRGPQKED